MIENLSIETVIIVACVCGSVVLILSVVLIVLCCQRHRTKDQYEKTDTNILDPPEAGKIASDVASLKTPDAATDDPSASTAPSHHPPLHPQQQQHLQHHLVDEDCSTRDPVTMSQVSLKDFNNVRFSYRASNPALANYPSLDRGTTNPSSHPMTSMTSAAEADDKRPRKVIYEVIV